MINRNTIIFSIIFLSTFLFFNDMFSYHASIVSLLFRIGFSLFWLSIIHLLNTPTYNKAK